jgi:type II secretory pathway pseudopilin PulG
MRFPKGMARAFTLIELIVIFVVIVLLAVCLVPGLVRVRHQADVTCMNNLKQVGLAFRISDMDSGGYWPMKVTTNAGGTMELVGSGQVFIHFRAISNELSTPKILVCPRDKAKVPTTNFASGFSDKNVSYWVGTDAIETSPQMLLSGDRNLAFQGQPIKPGLFVLTTNNASLSWTKAMHHPCGNVGFADGYVQL